MTPTQMFWLGAVGLAALAWLLLMPARGRVSAENRQQLNLGLRREQLATLDRQLADGRIDGVEHAQAVAEIERRVLEEVDARLPAPTLATINPPSNVAQAGAPAARRWVAAVGAGVAVLAFVVYGFLGNMAGLDHAPSVAASPAAGDEPSTAAVETMLDSMTERMAGQRDGTVDAAGWALVARSYAALQRFDRASEAYARALALKPDDAQLLADRADVMSMLQQGHMAGEPARLVARAMQLDPTNLKALALGGSEAFERRDFAAAHELWSQAKRLSPPGEFAEGIERSLKSLASVASNKESTQDGAPDALATATTTATGAAADAATVAKPSKLRLAGRLRVAPELAGRVAPTDQVFVFAREPGSVGMPIAIARFTANQLPLDFTLDAGNAMVDAVRLAAVTQLEIGARISRSGDATPRTGDLRGKSAPVAVDQSDLTVTIDDVTP